MDNLQNLRELHISTILSDKGMKFLGKIEKLVIHECTKITDESFKYLKRVNHLTLYLMDQLTNRVIKVLSKERKVMERVRIMWCENLENEEDWRKEMRIKNFSSKHNTL
jgi:hypothetical protein